MRRLLGSVAVVALIAACGSSSNTQGFNQGSPEAGVDGGTSHEGGILGGPDGSPTGPDGALGGDSAPPPNCTMNGPDLQGCMCTPPGSTRACYPNGIDPMTRNVGACKDGSQTCQTMGEFSNWGPCTGAVTPTTENCTGMVDLNCNGKVGCQDPSCANDPSCNTGCTNGQTRPCYDGPAGTENVGTCKDGTQTCSNGQWPTSCPGEVLPANENCCDALDHNCNGLPGCFDFFSCLTSSCCQVGCDMSKLDPGCVCPNGSGDTGTCPMGDHLVSQGGSLTNQECCPCTASDCNSDLNCCGTSICQGASACSGLTCTSLPPSCNGQVSTDCDDFPEDCDEPCCLCSMCP